MLEDENEAVAAKALSFYERACDFEQSGKCVGVADIMSAMPGVFSMDMIDRRACSDGGDTRGLACYNAGQGDAPVPEGVHALRHEEGVQARRPHEVTI